MNKMEIEEELKGLREKIETVDGRMLRLLNERAEIALEIGKVKTEGKRDLYDPQREGQVLEGLTLKNAGSFPQGALQSVFREIISACRSLEIDLTVAYLGPAASYTHLASIKHFGSSVHALSRKSLQEVFEAVETRKTGYGVVPIENSIEGAVDRTLDLLAESKLMICGEVLLRVSHALLSRTGKPEDVQEIYSHPQALGQCRKWLMKNFPHTSLAETASTAKAAEIAAGDGKVAAIASASAAEQYALKVIECRIEDYPHNYTRFLILGQENRRRTGRDKTSILFSTPHSPGALCQVLKVFSERRINLTKIESRPMRGTPWEYIFFVDFEGHATDPHVDETMIELKRNVLFMKFLGSYPRDSFETVDR